MTGNYFIANWIDLFIYLLKIFNIHNQSSVAVSGWMVSKNTIIYNIYDIQSPCSVKKHTTVCNMR